MAEKLLSFNRFLNHNSPVLILMGKENCRRNNTNELIPLGQHDEICWIRLGGVDVNLFKEDVSSC